MIVPTTFLQLLLLKVYETFLSERVKRFPVYFFCNWDSFHARLNCHYEAWGYKKRSTKRITGYIKSV